MRRKQLIVADLHRKMDHSPAHQSLKHARYTAQKQGEKGEQNMSKHQRGIPAVKTLDIVNHRIHSFMSAGCLI